MQLNGITLIPLYIFLDKQSVAAAAKKIMVQFRVQQDRWIKDKRRVCTGLVSKWKKKHSQMPMRIKTYSQICALFYFVLFRFTTDNQVAASRYINLI